MRDSKSSMLVSCVVATKDRPHFLEQTIACFLNQSHQPAELIIVDDGTQVSPDQAELHPNIRYYHLDQQLTLGHKLNFAIERARGQIIAKWDDDDYYHPDFLAEATAALRTAKSLRSLATWESFLVYLAGDDFVRYSGSGWTTGGTFCFFKALWKMRGFRDLPQAVDKWFMKDHQPELIPVHSHEKYILVRHGNNTWRQLSQDRGGVDDFMQSLPPYGAPLENLVEPFFLQHIRALSPLPRANNR